MYRSKLKIFVVVVALAVIIVTVLALSRNSEPKAGDKPATDVLSVVQQYIQAQENNVGADQSSPSAWLDKIKPITTQAWYGKLKPPSDQPTGDSSYNYDYAHQKNYIVKADISGCLWESILTKPNKNMGLVDCSLTDETIDRSTGKSIPASDLPFAWTAVGKQSSPRIVVVNKAGKWLVDGDLTGQAQ